MPLICLKPCPFCGGQAEQRTHQLYDGYQGEGLTYQVHCTECEAQVIAPGVTAAIDKWNHRHEEDTLLEAKEGNAMAPGVISEIMSHYKSPQVFISFTEKEEDPC